MQQHSTYSRQILCEIYFRPISTRCVLSNVFHCLLTTPRLRVIVNKLYRRSSQRPSCTTSTRQISIQLYGRLHIHNIPLRNSLDVSRGVVIPIELNYLYVVQIYITLISLYYQVYVVLCQP